LSHNNSAFCSGYLGDGVLQTICPGWPQTSILPLSASQVTRITGRCYQCPTKGFPLKQVRYILYAFLLLMILQQEPNHK
jgi:hypothetical protein